MVAGELVALLVTVALPGRLPADAGVKVTFRVAVWPGVKICPVEIPAAVYPAPEILTLDIVTLEFPALVNVTPWTLMLPMLMLEKLKLAVLALRRDVGVVTVRVAALLVTLPAAFVTVTVNDAPVSEAAVTGVV